MAYETGTATDIADLYNKLRDFLTTNTDLVTAGEEWTQIAGSVGTLTDADAEEIILQGPGTSGTDEILVGIRPFTSVSSDYYNLGFYGLLSYNAAAGGIASQVGVTTPRVLLAWDSPMTYWFVANGRRFIVVIKVATTYHMAYCGFVLPYMLPTLWPYPHFVGASCSQTNYRYSAVSNYVGNPFSPGQWTAACCAPDNQWLEFWNVYAANNNTGNGDTFSSDARQVNPWAKDGTPQRELLGGGYVLQQAELATSFPHTAQLAAMEGVFRVSGFSNAPENIVTVDLVDYLVIPNVYRNTWADFAAIRLE